MGQTLSPLRMRATASVMVSLASGIMGMMLAPLVIGTLNDHLNPMFGDMAIRYTMSFAILASAGAAISAFLGTRWMREDYAAAQAPIRRARGDDAPGSPGRQPAA